MSPSDKRPVVQAFGLKHCGVVALHPGQPGVLHRPHGDEQRAAVLGHAWPTQRHRTGNRGSPLVGCQGRHGGALLGGRWRRRRVRVAEGRPPAAGLAPGNRSRCYRRGIVSVCRGVPGGERRNLTAEVTVQHEVVGGVTRVYRDPAAAAAAAADGAGAGAGAAAGAGAGTACAGAGDPEPRPPQPPSGPCAPVPRQEPFPRCLRLRPPLPASAAAAADAVAAVAVAVAAAVASSAAAAGTTTRTWGSTDWCSSRCGRPSPPGGPG